MSGTRQDWSPAEDVISLSMAKALNSVDPLKSSRNLRQGLLPAAQGSLGVIQEADEEDEGAGDEGESAPDAGRQYARAAGGSRCVSWLQISVAGQPS